MLASQIAPLQKDEECKKFTKKKMKNGSMNGGDLYEDIFISYRLQNLVHHSPSLHIYSSINNTIEYLHSSKR